MKEITLGQLKSIRESLERNAACLTWSELREAFLNLYKAYDAVQKQLEEANTALQDAVLDDMQGEDLI